VSFFSDAPFLLKTIERDYIMRMISQLAAALAKILLNEKLNSAT